MQEIKVNNRITVLSDTVSVFKTAFLMHEAGAFSELDRFLSKLSQAVILSGISLKEGQYRLTHECGTFLFCIKKELFIFYGYKGQDAFIRRGDKRLTSFLRTDEFTVKLIPESAPPPQTDLLKLYRLSETDFTGFPRLDETQAKIVTTQDQNMLVQGVAGSGKTNLCIDKILYSASQNYAGRVLYSTFSRGLLSDTKQRVSALNAHIKRLITEFEEGRVVFSGANRVKAVENKLGFLLAAQEDKLLEKLKEIAFFLDNKVDYYVIEDLFRRYVRDGFETADEQYFVKTYVKDIKNHQLTSKLARVQDLSHEVIYKEIFGLITGACNPEHPHRLLSQEEYTHRRKHSFSRAECEIIYALSQDYIKHLQKSNRTDSNLMCRELLNADIVQYSLTILDEVQDFTEVSLVFFKQISRKLFCVGDALQMINASYFSFAYVKRLLYEKDISSVAELVSNYRSSKKIAVLTENLGKLNAKAFGVHSFVLKSKSVDANAQSEAVYVKGGAFLDKLNREPFNNYTVVTANTHEKEQLRKRLTKQEILTVAEIKGLERETVILYNILSANANRWRAFERTVIDRKTADENSVYRYYFNLLYVGVSRAKLRLYALESQHLPLFAAFFSENFQVLSDSAAVENLLANADKTEVEQDEILRRIKEFISQQQFDNARFAAQSIFIQQERTAALCRIDIAQNFIRKGLYRDAGLKFLQLGMYEDAKEQFITASDETLIKLADICLGEGSALGLEVLSALDGLGDNQEVQKIILGLVNADLQSMKENARQIGTALQKILKTNNR
ncbi:MAG: UvrD-helicase domain-containing protein [Firmicutes bacterium]|nr:UvrD-helicase domain-containing protein [Bacillota bacterium]